MSSKNEERGNNETIETKMRKSVVNCDLLDIGANNSGDENISDKHRLIDAMLADKNTPKTKPNIVNVSESSIMDKVKVFLPQLEAANKKLFTDIQNGQENEYKIEIINSSQENVVEMDLALFKTENSEEEEDSDSEEQQNSESEVITESLKLPNKHESSPKRNKIIDVVHENDDRKNCE